MITRGRLLLAVILAAQAALTLRLSNSAFLNEATYLYAGHREIAWLLHGTPVHDKYATYFSGSPVLYPVLGAAADAVGGLRAARLLSLAFMLGATALAHSSARILFGRRAALFAAAVFGLSEPVLFMGNLATYDALAVLLLAWAFRTAVRSGERRAYIADASLYAVLAVAVKYAVLAYLPVLVGVVAARAAAAVGWRRAWVRAVVMVFVISLMLGAALVLAGGSHLTGIEATTTARPTAADPMAKVARHAVLYGGAVFALACLGALFHARRGQGDRRARILLGVVLLGAALVAPASQMDLHTLVSLQKHVGYGLLFAAPLAGLALARIAVAAKWRGVLAFAGTVSVAAVGVWQSGVVERGWPDTGPMNTVIRDQVAADRARGVADHILAEDGDIPRYYLAETGRRTQVIDTYSFYYVKHGVRLTGADAYTAAIRDHYFTVVELDFGPTLTLDRTLARAVADAGYHQIAKLPYRTSSGSGYIYIWHFDTKAGA